MIAEIFLRNSEVATTISPAISSSNFKSHGEKKGWRVGKSRCRPVCLLLSILSEPHLTLVSPSLQYKIRRDFKYAPPFICKRLYWQYEDHTKKILRTSMASIKHCAISTSHHPHRLLQPELSLSAIWSTLSRTSPTSTPKKRPISRRTWRTFWHYIMLNWRASFGKRLLAVSSSCDERTWLTQLSSSTFSSQSLFPRPARPYDLFFSPKYFQIYDHQNQKPIRV